MKIALITACILMSSLFADNIFDPDYIPSVQEDREEIDLIVENETKEIVPGLKLRARWFEGSELLQVIYKKKQIFVLQTSEGGGVFVESFPGNELFCSYQKEGSSDSYWLAITKHLSEPDSFQIYITKVGQNRYRVHSDLETLLKEKYLNQPEQATP